MHFRIFIPGNMNPTSSPEPLKDVGLANIAEGFHAIGHRGAPDFCNGEGGAVFFWPKPGDTAALPPGKNLKWESAIPFRGLAAERYWVGYDPGNLPNPLELVVPLPITGDNLSLSSAFESWIIPDVLHLPAKLVLTADGVKLERLSRFQMRTFQAHAWISRCNEFISQIRDGRASDQIEWSHAWDFGYDSLTLNYRLTPEVVNLLGILSTDTLSTVILAAIGALETHRSERVSEALMIPEGDEIDG